MASKFAVIAVIGLSISAVCLGAAAAIGGRDFGGVDFPLFDGPRCEPVAGATATSRDLDWDGSDHAGIAIPARPDLPEVHPHRHRQDEFERA
jgi:hypothetical protein